MKWNSIKTLPTKNGKYIVSNGAIEMETYFYDGTFEGIGFPKYWKPIQKSLFKRIKDYFNI